ncbi:MAG TPA: flippase [Anaerolineales bacterium]|nr:flippase [Anaerolineales bacterium]
MIKQHSPLVKNSLWLLIARIGTQGAMVLFTILLARRLGSAGFGEYAFISAIIFVGNMLTTFGTDMTLIREIAAHDDLSQLPAALLSQLGFSIILILVIWMGTPFLPHQTAESILALRVYSFALIPLAFFTVFTIALGGKQQMDAYTWLNLTGSFLQLAIVWFFIKPNSSIVTLVFLLLFNQIIVSLIGAMICANQIQGFWRDWRFSGKKVSILLNVSTPLAILTVVAMLYQKLSVTMLSMMSGAVMTGLFSVSQRIVEGAKTGHAAIFTALYPAMAQNKNRSFRLSWILLLVGAGLGAITLSALAKPVTLILFGAEYEASIPALQILTWILIPYAVNTFLTLKFVASKNEKPVLQASLASLILLIVLNIYWIPRAGLIGAAWSALIAEIIQASLLIAYWRPT